MCSERTEKDPVLVNVCPKFIKIAARFCFFSQMLLASLNPKLTDWMALTLKRFSVF
jgi:hypothetical protein